MKDQLFTRADALKILPVNPSYLAELARSGKIKAERHGNRWLYSRNSLRAYAKKYRFAASASRAGRPWSATELAQLSQGKTPPNRTAIAARVKKSRIQPT